MRFAALASWCLFGALRAQQLTPVDMAADLTEVLALVATHPDPHWRHDAASWQAAATTLRARLPDLDEAAFTWELSRLVAMLHDGHSVLLPAHTSPLNRTTLPVTVRWFADGPFVLAVPEGAAALLGGRVTAIGGVALEVLLPRLAAGISADNEADLRNRLPMFVRRPWLLQLLGAAVDERGIAWTVVVDDREVTTVIAPVPGPTAANLPVQRMQPPADADLVAQRHAERRFFGETLPGLDAFYVRLRTIEDMPGQRLAAFLQEVPRLAQGQLASRLVIDVRGNPGGSNDHVRAFVRELRGSEFDADGRLFVITDGGTFSAAQNLCTWLERGTAARFVGEPTGGRPNHFGDAKGHTLPRTGAMVRVSTRRWQDSTPDDVRTSIEPDLPAPLTFADWRAGRDPALLAIAARR